MSHERERETSVLPRSRDCTTVTDASITLQPLKSPSIHTLSMISLSVCLNAPSAYRSRRTPHVLAHVTPGCQIGPASIPRTVVVVAILILSYCYESEYEVWARRT